MKAGYRLLGPI